jgi:hypothetical protein
MKWIPVIFFIGLTLHLSAQDTLPEGKIYVARPPVKALISLKVVYDYSYKSNSQRFWERRFKKAMRRYKSWLADPVAPEPVTVAADKEGDAKSDSIKRAINRRKNDRPAFFNWVQYFEPVNYYYKWTDSARIDSVTYVVDINRKGEMKVVRVLIGADDGAQELGRKVDPMIRALYLWFPAQQLQERSSKLKSMNCRVTITAYAYDPRYRMMEPLTKKRK